MKTVNIEQGINGTGNAVYLVQTITSDHGCIWTEKFSSKSEAVSWVKHACTDCDQTNDNTFS